MRKDYLSAAEALRKSVENNGISNENITNQNPNGDNANKAKYKQTKLIKSNSVKNKKQRLTRGQRSTALIVFVVAIMILAVLTKSFLQSNTNNKGTSGSNKQIENSAIINLPIDSKNAKGMIYTELKTLLNNSGFNNIELVERKEIVYDWMGQNNSVHSCTIDNKDFSKSTTATPETKIVIEYYTTADKTLISANKNKITISPELFSNIQWDCYFEKSLKTAHTYYLIDYDNQIAISFDGSEKYKNVDLYSIAGNLENVLVLRSVGSDYCQYLYNSKNALYKVTTETTTLWDYYGEIYNDTSHPLFYLNNKKECILDLGNDCELHYDISIPEFNF